MASNLIHSQQVAGPNGRFVRVLFYEDGAVRVRVEKAGPMVISQAFLTGAGKNVIIKLEPADAR